MLKAEYFSIEKNKHNVKCLLCPHTCVIAPGKTGLCHARKNFEGELFSLTYNEFTSLNIDPIEKKPLYHFYPGSNILSAGTFGCNLKCSFCQNWEISQVSQEDIKTRTISPQEMLRLSQDSDSIGIAYTYNEPLINYEWVKECAELFKENSLKNVLVTNGYINIEPWHELLDYIDAANIDIKSFNENFYEKICGGNIEPVLESVKAMVDMEKHVELTTLLIPGKNDSIDELEQLTDWIADLDDEIPLHFSRYFPNYKLDIQETDVSSMKQAYEIAKRKLKYVYLGNVNIPNTSNTFCSYCGELLIKRIGYSVDIVGLKENLCIRCGKELKIYLD